VLGRRNNRNLDRFRRQSSLPRTTLKHDLTVLSFYYGAEDVEFSRKTS
jgi:hypothetical protein